MLRFLGKRNRTRKLVLIAIVTLLALGLIVVFVPSDTSLTGLGGDDTVVASVAGHDITLKEYRQALSAFGRQIAVGQGSTRVDNPASVNALYGPQVMQNLIRQKLILYEAEQLNFKTTDGELQERLKQLFNPWPGPELYRRQLQQSGTTPIEFEDTLRASISEEKLRSYIGAGIQVSPQDVEEDYRRNNTNYSVRWVEVSPEKFRDKVSMDEPSLRAYFEQNKAAFHIDKEQRRARYILIDQSKTAVSVQVSDDELKQEFDPERGVQEVRVSQIVLNIPKKPAKADASADEEENDPEEQAKNKANDIVSRAKGDDTKQAEDFAALATEFSDDTQSKANGGDIGWIKKKDERKSDDPLNRVFTMQKDQVSQPIRKGDKFYILKVTDRKIPTFEDAREQLLKEAQARKAYSKAVEIGGEVAQKFKESKNAEAVASEINAKYGAQMASVKETPFFSSGENIPELGASPEFQSKVFELANTTDVAEPTSVPGGVAVPQLLEKREPHDPSFEEVKSKVEDRYRTDKAKELAAEQARQLAQSQTPDALKTAATSAGLKTDQRDAITGSDSIGPLVDEPSRQSVYKLNPGEVMREPIKLDNSDSYMVVSLISRKDADMGEAFQKQRKSIEENLLNIRRTAAFQSYLATIEKRLRDEGKIKIYQEAIDAALGPPPTGGGLPGQPQFPGRSSSQTMPVRPPQPGQ